MKQLRTIVLFLGLGVLTLSLAACCSTPEDTGTGAKPAAEKPAAAKPAAAKPAAPKPAAAKPAAAKPAGGALARLAGKWAGDIDALKKQNPEIEKNPMAKMLFAMLAGMKVEFTADTMTAEVMGQSKSVKFTVISSTADSLVIEASDGAKKGKKTEIKFIDDTHISLLEQGKPGPAMVLKRL